MTHIIRVSLLSVSFLQNHEAAQRLSATLWGCQRAPSDPNPPCSGRICPPHPASSRCSHPPVQSPAMDLARGERGRKEGFHPVRSSPQRPEHHTESRKERLGRAGPNSETPTQLWWRRARGPDCVPDTTTHGTCSCALNLENT